MKTCEYRLTLPFLEVVEKIQYELRWGRLKSTIDCQHTSRACGHLIVAHQHENKTVVFLINQVQDCVYLTITEPEDYHWAILIGELFLHHRLPLTTK